MSYQLCSTLTPFPSKLITTTRTNQNGFKVSCNAAPQNADNHNENNLVDRRNLLLGLGGICTATSLTSLPSAFADPITTPDISTNCKDAGSGVKNIEEAFRGLKCCPPNIGKTIKPFTFPTEETIRMRWPAHTGSQENIKKYKKAINIMRHELPDEHPHSFNSQARIHCAYCNGGYTQVATHHPEIELSIHNSWLFFPFHRWYLYFYERILGKLINDPTFALPYWNWDDPEGMQIPAIFGTEGIPNPYLRESNGSLLGNNPLYDKYRNPHHQQPPLVDLSYSGKDGDRTIDLQKKCNFFTVYRDLIRNGTDAKSFFGGRYVSGSEPVANGDKSVGSVEAGSHTAVHIWVGDPNQPNGEDMANFYSAGYDPLFYAHHSNVDRMWVLWKELGIRGHKEPKDNDWLNASYVFYDENEELVRVYNKDCVDPAKLKFGYERSKSEMPWRKSRPNIRIENNPKPAKVSSRDVKTVDRIKFPAKLEMEVPILSVKVKRPAVNRTPADKEKSNEILFINGIRFNSNKFVKFDVFVNDNLKDDKLSTPCDVEFAGTFAQVPHGDKRRMFMYSGARFGLDELLEDTKTEDEEYAIVNLVSRAGCDDLTVSGIEIKLVPIED
ncbi:polyphenol oxidase, chloroplastic-like [Rutidosis leptorrhynchoides]|uniref:polyphenol oxidase, chloroplastic-like n=1 Tax=Rutidosis leptorrhynchoides TaxID=125765 RepID=UPI003A98F1C7